MKSKLIIILISVSMLILLSLNSYLNFGKYHPPLNILLDNPVEYDRVLVEVGGNIFNKSRDYFYLNSTDAFYQGTGNRPIKVIYQNVDSPVLGPVSVYGRFHKEGYIDAIVVHYHNYDFLKYPVSFMGLIIFLIIFFREWRITKSGFARTSR